MYSSGMFMTREQVREFKTLVDRIGRPTQFLRSSAEQANVRYYQVCQKCITGCIGHNNPSSYTLALFSVTEMSH